MLDVVTFAKTLEPMDIFDLYKLRREVVDRYKQVHPTFDACGLYYESEFEWIPDKKEIWAERYWCFPDHRVVPYDNFVEPYPSGYNDGKHVGIRIISETTGIVTYWYEIGYDDATMYCVPTQRTLQEHPEYKGWKVCIDRCA